MSETNERLIPMAPYNTDVEDSNPHNQHASLDDLDRFPPTVVDSEEYGDGYDLELLDSGTEENPRFIRIVDDEPALFVLGGGE